MSGPFKMKGYSYSGTSPLKQDEKRKITSTGSTTPWKGSDRYKTTTFRKGEKVRGELTETTSSSGETIYTKRKRSGKTKEISQKRYERIMKRKSKRYKED